VVIPKALSPSIVQEAVLSQLPDERATTMVTPMLTAFDNDDHTTGFLKTVCGLTRAWKSRSIQNATWMQRETGCVRMTFLSS